MNDQPQAAPDLAERLASRLNTDSSQAEAVGQAMAEAQQLVDRYAAEGTPDEIKNLAAIEVAAELWARRDAKGGIIAAFTDGPATRLARDPMVAAYPILDPWKAPVFG